jgi:hypothetical protein
MRAMTSEGEESYNALRENSSITVRTGGRKGSAVQNRDQMVFDFEFSHLSKKLREEQEQKM